MRVLTLFLRYGADKYPNAEPRMHDIANRTLNGVARDTLVIDNSLPSGFTGRTPAGSILIGGDNAYWEFSGWDTGIQHIAGDLWSYDYIHFVTSAFEELYSDYLDLFSVSMLRQTVSRPAALGHIDFFNTPVSYFGYTSQHWIRSSYFFVRPAEVRALGSLVSLRDDTNLFTSDPANPFRNDAPLDDTLQQNIIGWLTGAGTGQGVEWHSRFSLSQETLPYFRAKTRALLNEHLLSARLRAIGCNLLDVTWLASGSLSRDRHGWREQMRNRLSSPAVLQDV